MNICAECKHYDNDDDVETWYDHLCHHPKSQSKEKINHITGKKYFSSQNSLELFTYGEGYALCIDINKKGECKLYEAKP